MRFHLIMNAETTVLRSLCTSVFVNSSKHIQAYNTVYSKIKNHTKCLPLVSLAFGFDILKLKLCYNILKLQG